MSKAVEYIVETGGGTRSYLQVTTDEEALARFAKTKAKTRWGFPPRLVKETREILAEKKDAPRAR